MLFPSPFLPHPAGSASGQAERVVACGRRVTLQCVRVDGTMFGVAVPVARLDLAANSQTCWVSGLRFGWMLWNAPSQPFVRIFFLSRDRWVWPSEGLVCGTVAKGEAVLCARSEIGLFWKREGEGSGGTETAQLTIPGAPEASVRAQPLAKWQWQVISSRLSCELTRLGMLLSCLNDSGQNKIRQRFRIGVRKSFSFLPL